MLILVNDDLILNGRCDVLTNTTDVLRLTFLIYLSEICLILPKTFWIKLEPD